MTSYLLMNINEFGVTAVSSTVEFKVWSGGNMRP